MKHLNSLFILLITLFLFISCKKEKVSPIEQLPAATQEGKNTFGCLVNGNVFKPKGSFFGGANTECYYQYINSNNINGYVFQVAGFRKEESRRVSMIRLHGDDILLKEGETYQLLNQENTNMYGSYFIISNPDVTEYSTSTTSSGELKITHFDPEKFIVSGTFWFDAVNAKGEKVEVREGRFDMQFTR
jgi:hypothetical protein